ncbi:MAG: FMN-binding negative transcriptional regulator [Flavobacteriales bacterium]|nr:FMN-binding negative transcriptional regulator [Flavobacteriales bacterium]MCB9449066.1 FMN-binding negative transcriptional regulator [Flavobacteriales bacterium]
MYIPKHYLNTDREEVLQFMRAHNFATLVTVDNNMPSATHVPFTIKENGDDLVLSSHLSKANPQWMQLKNNPVLVIFTEPHAYISPKHYEREMNVPTWNYISVHAYGQAALLTDASESTTDLEAMIMETDPGYKAQWDRLPDDYKRKMLNGIVAFRITVTEIQAKNKLSQNKKEGERQSIIAALENSSHDHERAIAEAMKLRS